MRFKPLLATALLLLSISRLTQAQTALRDKPEVADALKVFDLWIEQFVDYRDIPGLSIAIVHDQEIVWTKGYGYADLKTKTPATPSTVYRLGSITKLFTSSAIMKLRDEGKLRLDNPVASYLPWFHVSNPFPDEPKITVRELLTHSSGLPREAAFPYWTDHIFPTQAQFQEAEAHQEVLYPPDTTYHYSNLGMALLGAIVAEVSGRPWAEYVDEEILHPLGMNSSSGAPDKELLSRRATSYMMPGPDGVRGTFPYYDTGAMRPAANMVSSVEDLSRFAALQFREGPNSQSQILANSTLRDMRRVHWVYPSFSGGRGLGFAVSRRDGKTIVGHGGWIGGNRTHLLLVPDEKIAVIVALNADDGSPYTVARQAYDAIGPALVEATREPAPPKGPADPEWQRYVGLYSDPWGWKYRIMILDDQLVEYAYDVPPHDDATSGFTTLEPVEGTTFRMPDLELVTFELDAERRVVRIKRRNDYIFPVNE